MLLQRCKTCEYFVAPVVHGPLIGWFAKPKYVVDEMTKNGEHFGRKTLYTVMVKYVAPVLLIVLFIQAIGVLKL